MMREPDERRRAGANRWRVTVAFVLAASAWIPGDLATTFLALEAGAVEANPAGRLLLTEYGFTGAFVLKVVTAGLVAVQWGIWRVVLREMGAENSDSRLLGHSALVFPLVLGVVGAALTIHNTLVYLQLRGL